MAKKHITLGIDVYTKNLNKAAGDWVRLTEEGAEPNLYVNTWNEKAANLSLSNVNFNQKVWAILEEIKEDEEYVSDTSDLD